MDGRLPAAIHLWRLGIPFGTGHHPIAHSEARARGAGLNARWRTAAALAFLFALTVAYYRQLTLESGYTWLENPDQALQVRPWFDYQARELHAGRLPFWDPYQVGGQSLIGQVQPGLANP